MSLLADRLRIFVRLQTATLRPKQVGEDIDDRRVPDAVAFEQRRHGGGRRTHLPCAPRHRLREIVQERMKGRAETAGQALEEEKLGTLRARPSANFPEKTRFADAGVPLDQDHGALSRKDAIPELPDGIQFVLTVDQRPAHPSEGIEAVHPHFMAERPPHFLRRCKALELLAALKHEGIGSACKMACLLGDQNAVRRRDGLQPGSHGKGRACDRFASPAFAGSFENEGNGRRDAHADLQIVLPCLAADALARLDDPEPRADCERGGVLRLEFDREERNTAVAGLVLHHTGMRCDGLLRGKLKGGHQLLVILDIHHVHQIGRPDQIIAKRRDDTPLAATHGRTTRALPALGRSPWCVCPALAQHAPLPHSPARSAQTRGAASGRPVCLAFSDVIPT